MGSGNFESLTNAQVMLSMWLHEPRSEEQSSTLECWPKQSLKMLIFLYSEFGSTTPLKYTAL